MNRPPLVDQQERAAAILEALQPDLAREARQLLAELALVSCGTITAYAPSSRSGAGPRDPSTGDKWPAHHELLHRLAEAISARQVRDALDWARAELDALRRGPDTTSVKGETTTERAARLVRDGEGLSPSEAAARLAVPTRELITARTAAGRDAWDGWPARKSTEISAEERQRRAAEWAGQGVPATVIAKRLNQSVTTIRRDLGRRAA